MQCYYILLVRVALLGHIHILYFILNHYTNYQTCKTCLDLVHVYLVHRYRHRYLKQHVGISRILKCEVNSTMYPLRYCTGLPNLLDLQKSRSRLVCACLSSLSALQHGGLMCCWHFYERGREIRMAK